jgi:DNA-binding transcriptional regulator YhcF (GntR family)
MAHRVEDREPAANPFATDPGDELPVGLQLSWRLRALIASGRLGAGERLPSFRRLSDWAGVNVNTVRAVYAGLEAEGLVVSRQGQGTFVAEGIAAAPQLEQIATEALARAREAGLSPRDLAIVAAACASMPEALGGDVAAERAAEPPEVAGEGEAIEVRHELRRQIARLEAELATYPPAPPGELATAPRRATAHVAGVGELERTRDTLIARLSAAQRAAEQRAREKGRERALEVSPLERAMSWWRRKS